MAKQQTALNFLLEKLTPYIHYPYGHSSGYDVEDIIEQAKQMEKDQIEMAHYHNRCINDQSYDCTMKAFYDAQEYYINNYEN